MFRDRIFNEERFFRRSRRDILFQKGDLKYIILDMIKENPRHGYDIIQELEGQSFGFYKPSPGVIYPTLQMLEEMGYASSIEQEGKRVYSITEGGLKFLAEKSNIANSVRKRVRHKWSFKSIGKMVMVMKQYHALEHLLGRGFRSLDDDKAEQIRQILSSAYQAIESVLQD